VLSRSAGAAGTGHVVAALALLGQREEPAEGVVGRIDARLRDAVAADPGEAPFAIGGAEFGDEGLAIGGARGMGEAADVEGGDGGGGVRACVHGVRLPRPRVPRPPGYRGWTASGRRRRLRP